MSEQDGFFKVKIERSTEKAYKDLKAKKEKLRREIEVLQERYDNEIKKTLKIDDPTKRVEKLQTGLSQLRAHRMGGKVEPNWADRKLRLFEREIDKAENQIYKVESADGTEPTKRGRPPKNAKVKKGIRDYYRENRNRLEEENKDEEGYPIQKWIAEQILEEKDEDLGISKEYADPIRTITLCMEEVKHQ
ncbi:hypothetical protein ACG2F4_14460 [Halalkalibaculum sp. DA3122]|uniref:hypothetical protein n=1 Tax=Halalkalibaculum sp. DA3122 TaxID=3373607 RepID=UPI003755269B